MQPTPNTNRRQVVSIILALALITVGAGVAVYGTTDTAEASSSLALNSLSVADANTTVNSDVRDVTLGVSVDYEHEVPDATRRIVKVKVGPSKQDLELLTYSQTTDLQGTETGTVSLSGSLLKHSAWDASTFDPALAGNTTTTVVVQATIEIERANGETERHSVTDTATVVVRDGTVLVVRVGGSGSFTVST